MSSKYLEGLNDEQMQAATSIDGAVRLIAGAGSGKTFTLTRRVANICETKGIHPSRVLSLTFTIPFESVLNLSVVFVFKSTTSTEASTTGSPKKYDALISNSTLSAVENTSFKLVVSILNFSSV